MAKKVADLMQSFMHWYESYQGKKIVGMVYSLGAAVVIVGALFKILHLQGASTMLFIGMMTEALLFSIGCLDKPHPEYHWEEVFPQLVGHGTEPAHLADLQSRPRPTLLGAGVADGVAPAPASAAGEAKPKSNVPALSNEDMEALKGGINDLAKTAVQLSELGKVATSTTKLGEKMEAASAAAEKFVGSQDALTATSEALGKAYQNVETEMQGVLAGTQNFGKGIETVTMSVANVSKSVDAVTKSMEVVNQSVTGVDKGVQTVNEKLSSLNAVYELQLNAVQSQIEAYKAQAAQVQALSGDVQKMQVAVAESVKYQEAYQEGSKKLADQIANLNKVYGNMLTALA